MESQAIDPWAELVSLTLKVGNYFILFYFLENLNTSKKPLKFAFTIFFFFFIFFILIKPFFLEVNRKE